MAITDWLRSILPRRTVRPDQAQGEALLADLPITLNIGTLTGAKRKDVLAYARGLAESQVIAKDAAYLDAFEINGRWVYEIHEGGAGCALAHALVAQFDARSPEDGLLIPLTGDRVARISAFDGELNTIIFPPDPDRHARAVEALRQIPWSAKVKPLEPLHGTCAAYRVAGQAVLAASLVLFVLSAGLWFVRSNAIDTSAIAGRAIQLNKHYRTSGENLPAVQMDKALAALTANTAYLSYLKYENGRWTHAQSTANLAMNLPSETISK